MAKDIIAKTGSYIDKKTGQEKAEWTKIGVILSNDKGEYALIDPTINLAGVLIKQRLDNPEKAGGSVMASVVDNSQQRQQATQQTQSQGDPGFDDSTIPF